MGIKSTSISEYCRNSVMKLAAPESSRNPPRICTLLDALLACVSTQIAGDVVRNWPASSGVSRSSKNVDRADFGCGWDVPTLRSLLKRRLYRRFVSVFNTVTEALSRCCALRGKRSGMVMSEQKEEDGPSTHFPFHSFFFFFFFLISFNMIPCISNTEKKNRGKRKID